ncbi:PQQ-binding-like beta-propeller repeat protein [Herbihabitans rhizosphaerae]|uniref:outer membrane protein assembly factor BamB family protein n=1 Tax=Herbihabitans rhizosphaerae TaxID=1872711 RepID=UPI0013EE5C2A|nr:PQQ-binding-like beta-propeller repeat protein [Herbihabitans rhizosphaerae]
MEPIKVDPSPLWDSDSIPLKIGYHQRFATRPEIRGDTVILFGTGDDLRTSALAVVDAPIGKPLWSYREGERLRSGKGEAFVSTGAIKTVDLPGGRWGVLVVFGFPTKPYGLVEARGQALLAQDGQVLWTSPIDGSLTAMAANDKTVFTWRGSNADRATVAIDIATGKRIWDNIGSIPYAVASGTVVSLRPTPETAGGNLDDQAGAITGVDSATGTQRWDLGARYPKARPIATAGHLVLVHTDYAKYEARRVIVLDARTGTEIADLGEAPSDACGGDGRTIVACAVRDRSAPAYQYDLRSVRADEGRVHISARTVTAGRIDGIWAGRIFLTDFPMGKHPHGTTIVDREGNQLSQKLLMLGTAAVSDTYVAVQQPSGVGPIAIHRIVR